MDSYPILLKAIAPVFFLIAIGGIFRKTGWLTEQADKAVMKLVVNLFYPCLFLHFLIGNPRAMNLGSIIIPPLFGFATITFGFLLAYFIAKGVGLKKGSGLRTFAFSSGIYNYGYIPIPLVVALFSDRETTGILLIYNVGIELAIWTVGILLLGGKLNQEALKKLINPPVIALATAVFINMSGLYKLIPIPVLSTIEMLSQCAIPIGLLLSGAITYDLLQKDNWLSNPTVHFAALITRIGILPIAFLSLLFIFPNLSIELKRVIVVQAAMPAGVFPIVLARHYGGDPSIAVKIVLTTTCACLITLPLWIIFGLSLIS